MACLLASISIKKLRLSLITARVFFQSNLS